MIWKMLSPSWSSRLFLLCASYYVSSQVSLIHFPKICSNIYASVIVSIFSLSFFHSGIINATYHYFGEFCLFSNFVSNSTNFCLPWVSIFFIISAVNLLCLGVPFHFSALFKFFYCTIGLSFFICTWWCFYSFLTSDCINSWQYFFPSFHNFLFSIRTWHCLFFICLPPYIFPS